MLFMTPTGAAKSDIAAFKLTKESTSENGSTLLLLCDACVLLVTRKRKSMSKQAQGRLQQQYYYCEHTDTIAIWFLDCLIVAVVAVRYVGHTVFTTCVQATVHKVHTSVTDTCEAFRGGNTVRRRARTRQRTRTRRVIFG